jgi:Fur family ferric uptake transcriptional regulator
MSAETRRGFEHFCFRFSKCGYEGTPRYYSADIATQYLDTRLQADPMSDAKMAIRHAELESILKSKGFRITEPRKVILRLLGAMTDHPDVVELHKRVSKIDPEIGISTVYRTVNVLAKLGMLERHTFADGRARYETTEDDHHDHMVNIHTGQIIEFQSAEIERLQNEIAREHGFRIVSHRFELYVEPLEDSRSKRSKASRQRSPRK